MWKRTAISLPVALITLALLGGAEGIDPDELACEQAVKHLIDCCPPDAPATKLECYSGRDCDDTRPDLSSTESESIVGSSCDELVAANECNHKRSPPPQPSSTNGFSQ
jgi:hypothetical protein